MLSSRAVVPAFLLALFLAGSGCGNNHPNAPIVIPPLDSLKIPADTLTLRLEQTVQFTVVGYDTNGVQVNGVPATWSTDDLTQSVIALDPNGQARGVGEGTAMVFAEYAGLRDSAIVVVGPVRDGWYMQTSNATNVDLNGVFFLSDARTGWAVGNTGKIVFTQDAGEHWSTQVSNTGNQLNGVWFTSAMKGWAFGKGGTVLHTTNGGTTWTRVTTISTLVELTDGFFASDSTGWVVGDNGLIFKTTNQGGSWTTSFPPTSALLNDVYFSGPDGWAVGDGGVIVGTHDSGAQWFVVQPAVTTNDLRAVVRRSESLADAVGALGVAPRTVAGLDSTTWELRNLGSANQLYGVHFPTDLTGFAVGFNATGLVLRTDDGGLTWRSQASNEQQQLNDVFFVGDQNGWAVGKSGTIIHTGTGGE